MSTFVTGANGFVGRRLLGRRTLADAGPVVALVRRSGPEWPGVRTVTGDLRAPEEWRGALAGCDTIVHLAARTGAGSAVEHDRANREGTEGLLAEARAAGVRRFLFVSTIATTYPEHRDYPYARAKARAEAAVAASGLDTAIVRPTIVLGPGSPVGASLRSLAGAPVLPLFGAGGARIQPVHVDDVVDAILALLARGTWGGLVADLGGPDVVPFGAFLRELRRETRGTTGPSLPVPVSPLIALLGGWERAHGPRLPLSAGQLYAFRHDGVAREGADALPVPRHGVAAMIAELAAGDVEERPVRSPFPPPPGATPPSGSPAAPAPSRATPAELDAECDAIVRWLTGAPPSALVLAKYRDAHRPGLGGPADLPPSFDDELAAYARRGAAAAGLADTWAAIFSRGGAWRRKTVLVLAILESDGRTSAALDRPEPGGTLGFAVRTAGRGALFLARLAVAAIVLGPRARRARRAAVAAASTAPPAPPPPGAAP